MLIAYFIIFLVEKELQAKEKIKKEKEKSLEILNWQTRDIESRNKTKRENIENEKKKLQEKWTQDLIENQEKKKQDKFNNIKNFKEIEELNKFEYQKKLDLLNEEKLKDKKLISSIVEKEKALDELDKKEKVKNK